MKKLLHPFTLIELATSMALIVVLFGMISYVFQAVSISTLSIASKLQEADKANRFFQSIGDDIEAGYPVFYLGEGSSGIALSMGQVGGGNPMLNLPMSTGGAVATFKPLTAYGNTSGEFFRCVSNVVRDGGPQLSTGALLPVNREGYLKRPIRYNSYFILPDGQGVLMGNRTIIRREIFMRPDVRKGKSERAGYVMSPSAVSLEDPDVREIPLVDGVWEVSVEAKEVVGHQVGNARKVFIKISVEFAYEDKSFDLDDPGRYTRYVGSDERKDHTYTAIFVTELNPWIE